MASPQQEKYQYGDIEKMGGPVATTTTALSPPASLSGDDTSSDRVKNNNGVVSEGGWFRRFLARLRGYEIMLDRKLGLEARGPERVPEDERKPPSVLMMMLLWASTTMNLSAFSTGLIGYEMKLSFKTTVLCIIFGSLLGSMVTAWCATLGPQTGLRQVSISRYSLGWWPSKIAAVLNVVSQCGWTAVGSITGGLSLTAVSNGKVTSALGVIIVTLIGAVFSTIGLKAVLLYEKWAWIAFFIIFMVIFGEAGSKVDLTPPTPETGASYAGTVLTFLSVMYGSSSSWCSIVSDYYVEYAVNTSKQKVFWLTTCGIWIFTSIACVAGATVGSSLQYNVFLRQADASGLGYLIQDVIYPRGFAKFVLVLLVLSAVGNNCVAMYSGALSIQQFARPLQLIPRFIWSIVVFVIVLLLSLAGRDHLLSFLSNFLPLLGYWSTVFFAIVFSEHYIFRKGNIRNYDLDAWNDPKRLPFGYAGLGAFVVGLVGAVLGMNEEWYTGVIAKQIGGGGDIGSELALALTCITYPILRWAELKYNGR